MDINALNILAEAISDVGSWWCWQAGGDVIQVEFCDVQLYDDSKAEQEPRSTGVLAVRFRGHAFAVFLDNLDEDGWHDRLRDDDSVLYPVETYALAFDDAEGARSLLDDYGGRTFVNGTADEETLAAAKHVLFARCGEVGLVAGGDAMEVVGQKGKYAEEEIGPAHAKWWDYWKAYWKLRGTKAAYPEDYVCEITIPVNEN